MVAHPTRKTRRRLCCYTTRNRRSGAVRAATFSFSLPSWPCSPAAAAQRAADRAGQAEPAPHSKLLNELSGSLIGAPAGSDVELALLEVDRRDQPDRLLSNVQLKGRGTELPFILQFNPDTFRPGQRVELRGRVTRAGQLIMRLPSRSIPAPPARRRPATAGPGAVTAPAPLTGGIERSAGRRTPGCRAAAGHRSATLADRRRQHGSRLQPQETRRILEDPPYWSFCWASGLVLARWLADRPEWVRGKRVLDFGAGSGVAAIAAPRQALPKWWPAIWSLALAACRANAALNGSSYAIRGTSSARRIALI